MTSITRGAAPFHGLRAVPGASSRRGGDLWSLLSVSRLAIHPFVVPPVPQTILRTEYLRRYNFLARMVLLWER